MGIYIFNARLLEKLLIADAADDKSAHDFGKNVIPAAIDVLQVVAYPFTDVKTRAQNYWRDVGTVDAFYEANIELVHVAPELNLYDEEWPIWTYQLHQPPAKFVLDEDGRRGTRGQLHGLGRLHHLRRLRQSVAAVLQRAGRGALHHLRARWCCRTSRSAPAATSATPSSMRAAKSRTACRSASTAPPMPRAFTSPTKAWCW